MAVPLGPKPSRSLGGHFMPLGRRLLATSAVIRQRLRRRVCTALGLPRGRREFNAERPHEVIAMKCPAEIYTPSMRPHLGLPDLAYPFHGRDVLVTACGRICLHRKKINVSTVLAGQRLGIKEVDEGIWLVSFIDYDLGYIDLEQRTLQTLDNPFGPRLSPMS
jgi:hypothetical protein